jgi:hypothetical protein
MRYRSQRTVAPELVEDLRQVAMERPCFGYRPAARDAEAQGLDGEPEAGAAARARERLARSP